MLTKLIDQYPLSTMAVALGCGCVLGLTVSTLTVVRFTVGYALKKAKEMK